VQPSDYLALDIYSNGFAPGEDVYFALVCNPAGTISGGAVVKPPAPDATMLDPGMGLVTPDGGLGIYGFIGSMTIPQTSAPAGTYINGIVFHCEGPADAIVHLYTTVDGGSYALADTLLVHQIPEPATIALLCLGGLLLRKRS